MIKRVYKTLIRMAVWPFVLLVLVGTFTYGFLCNERKLPGYTAMSNVYTWCRDNATLGRLYFFRGENVTDRDRTEGRWMSVTDRVNGLTDEQRQTMAKLQTIGYLGGYESAPGMEGVTIYVPEFAYDGLNLYTSGHGQQALLMNMSGRILHTWSYEFRDAFPDHPVADGQWHLETWVRVHPFANGDLLVIYEGLGMIKLDKNSNLIWANPRSFHHDLFVTENEFIYALSKEVKIIPRIHEYEPVVEDFITLLDQDGNIVRNVSILEAFERSSYASFLNKMPEFGDLLHTNTIEVLDGSLADRSGNFSKGNILISARDIDVIAIVDMESEKVVWALSGQWKAQHHPTMLENGQMLLFDNRGHHGMSKVIEIDPFTQQIVWSYEGTPQNGFYTRYTGANQRLPNGNTLITESRSGRALEVMPDGTIVWEYYNPARAGDDKELIAVIFELKRLEPAFMASWLDHSDSPYQSGLVASPPR